MESNSYVMLNLLARTASENSPGFDASRVNYGVFFLNVTAKAGTSPTLDVTIQHSADNVIFNDLVSFTQATAETTAVKTAEGLGRYVRAKTVIGGSDTPSFTFSVKATLKG